MSAKEAPTRVERKKGNHKIEKNRPHQVKANARARTIQSEEKAIGKLKEEKSNRVARR